MFIIDSGKMRKKTSPLPLLWHVSDFHHNILGMKPSLCAVSHSLKDAQKTVVFRSLAPTNFCSLTFASFFLPFLKIIIINWLGLMLCAITGVDQEGFELVSVG